MAWDESENQSITKKIWNKNIKQNPTIYFMAIKSKIEQLSISIQPAYYIPNHISTSRKICSLWTEYTLQITGKQYSSQCKMIIDQHKPPS